MKILVTGCAGFIGSHLCERLLAQDHDLYGVDNLETGRRENVPAGVSFREADIGTLDPWLRASSPSLDLVVHCAASYRRPADWWADIRTNITGMTNVCRLARLHGAAVAYFQTALPETSSYAISKTAGLRYLQLSGLPSTTFVLANVYGPRNLSGPVPAFTKRLLAGEPCVVSASTRDFVYIDDLLDYILDRGLTCGGLVYCGSGQQIPVERVYEALERALGVRREFTRADLDGDVSSLDAGAAIQPTVSLEDGVAAAVAWYREHGIGETYTHLGASR